MTLSLYNTLTRQKQRFEPLQAGSVSLYCCGVTVYDYCHLGHARSYIVWDTLRRYLLWLGYRVRYVQNFTDIDDKILRRSRQEGTTMQAIADRYTQAYFEDMARLNILEADDYPRATHTLDGIQRLIAELEDKGFAYAADGDVYFSVRRFQDYGKLSGRKLEDLKAGASGRVESAEESLKHDPFDFALWKAAKPEEPAWDSPWGPGRPGWHIECSAMVRDRLGDSIDIHVGGADLVFPHHENEIAQSEAVTGHPLARYWLHNGMVNVGGEKMSKSLGNFTTIRQLLDEGGISPMVLRLFVLQANYRKPIDFTDEALQACQNGWETLQEGLHFGEHWGDRLGWTESVTVDPDLSDRFRMAMDDDLNTPAALAVLFELAKELRRQQNLLIHEGHLDGDAQQLHQHWVTLVQLAGVLGLEAEPELAETNELDEAAIEDWIAKRHAARQAKDFAEADRIRHYLADLGITLIDQAGGITRWSRT
ncbi:cysteine--tRNA ligase [Synechococcus elongatus]|uniref:Cysteine--tRNA ligase n=2 Tax=Synechococcus elongatus TaxID=32046 RepID=SYC_SYNE7|nr:cysteine--tRNA ligase [Synechococcus elongatus]Q31MM7.1 RecName: Full=Cysteine--tRNA ligase; AltName: Full=Cysteinyl-tRNA synthetase; Short=CysRS [Synechococcus elongatus PCC 7942 = FACHB-805]Q5MZA4.1 RecName: Full=Cysteine--tRNA ligase; AltName: Full=Cysteinyl-tRNA synthetase; Short=CysRS [Synechococcus elongatus PCC 6301]ABB57692.1 cysteinyl-tRNA synthetase [Synechococcus elongatus PCC 7942 = FACHB-805]AJD57817.1 cysteinyl-tRNA synthetase [Synechococcus elongatus UTEX 2973]MBD2586407.1 cy